MILQLKSHIGARSQLTLFSCEKINFSEKYFSKFEKYGKSSFQRGFFETLGKTYGKRDDLIFWFLSQFTNELDHPDDFDSDFYEDYKKRMNDFNFYLRLDIENIVRYVKEYDITFHELFISKGINHPPILKLSLSKTKIKAP